MDGNEFSLSSAQIIAIKEFVVGRQLIPYHNLMARWQGNTAAQAAEILARKMRDDDLNARSSATITFRLKHITGDDIQLLRAQRFSDGRLLATFTIDVKWEDLFVVSFIGMFRCGVEKEESHCVRRVPIYDFEPEHKGIAQELGWHEATGGWLNVDRGAEWGPYSMGLSYIYYRVMFVGDFLAYYPAE